jgi:hypothetical protein
MHQRTLELRESVLGKEHPDTLMSIYCLAHLLQRRKRYDDSSIFYQRALLGYEKRLGLDHPTTLACSKHYSSLLEEIAQPLQPPLEIIYRIGSDLVER